MIVKLGALLVGIAVDRVKAGLGLGDRAVLFGLGLGLAERDARQAKIVELRFFGGLTVAEVAEVLGVSKRTVEGEWTMIRAWLRRELAGDAET